MQVLFAAKDPKPCFKRFESIEVLGETATSAEEGRGQVEAP
jgi:hypothetical protein